MEAEAIALALNEKAEVEEEGGSSRIVHDVRDDRLRLTHCFVYE